MVRKLAISMPEYLAYEIDNRPKKKDGSFEQNVSEFICGHLLNSLFTLRKERAIGNTLVPPIGEESSPSSPSSSNVSLIKGEKSEGCKSTQQQKGVESKTTPSHSHLNNSTSSPDSNKIKKEADIHGR